MGKSLLALLCVAFAIAVSAKLSYSGFSVLRITVQPGQNAKLDQLEREAEEKHWELDWWQEPLFPHGGPVVADVMVSPAVRPQIESWLSMAGLEYRVWIQDVQATATQQLLQVDAGDWFGAYHDYNETVAWIHELARNYSNIVTIDQIGQSYEGRTMYAVRIRGQGRHVKPGAFFDGGIHAREWISPMVVQYILHSLASGYGKDPEVTALVDAIDWTVVPIFNVDGYQYSHTHDRMWRKTRKPNQGSTCVGTDPCRNAPTGWGGAGASANPCAQDYRGTHAFSEVEVANVANYLASLTNTKFYVNFHSYSELWMSPFGYTYNLPAAEDYKLQMRGSQLAVQAIQQTHGHKYKDGPTAATIYQASGVMSDYAYSPLNITLSYIVELRDKGQYGFLLPASQIRPCGEEIWAAVRAVSHFMLENLEQL